MEILNAILLIWAGIIIIFQVFFINFLQKQNEKLLKLAKEQQEVNIEMNNLNKKILKINEEQQEALRDSAEIMLLREDKANFYRENYVPKCPECSKEGADMEIMPNGQCERCSYEKNKK